MSNFTLYSDPHEDEEKLKDIKNLNLKKVRMFIMSFLDFLHNPDVEIMKKEFSPIQRTRKIKKGQYHKNHNYIKLNGKTKFYVDNVDEEHFSKEYLRKTHSWVVRGFYRNLKNKIYKFARKIWIAPFIKGNGNVSEKDYFISDKKKLWVSQLKMETIIKEIFPKYLVITNTRSFLDGLEIDCYLPNLKIGFEYNGEQHYNFPNIFHKTKDEFEMQQERDIEKNKLAKERGINLITIKYNEPLTKTHILKRLKGGEK